MADDLQNYILQLQQVETALLTDAENEGLLKLKSDLEEVIELTRDLIKTKPEEQSKSVEPSAFKATYDEIEAVLLEAEKLITLSKTWNIGDKCQTKWTEDSQFYDAHNRKNN
uniref:Tudor domain-containing protein n=1 Tax=Glossina brevipalpis TaxID=37001 RepID=A0A1A9WFD6_9MUSC